MEYRKLLATNNVNMEAQCFFQYVYGFKDRFDPHYHEFYEIFLTIKGTVMHHINGVDQKLPEGSLVFIRPDDRHGYRYEGSQCRQNEYINLTFTTETAEEMFHYLSDGYPTEALLRCPMPPMILLSEDEKKSLVKRISELNCTDWDDKRALKLQMRVLLVEIFTHYFVRCLDEGSDNRPPWLSQLMARMEHPENFVLGNDQMVRLSGRTREHVARSLQKYCGVTVADYINRLRVNYASNLLLNTNTPILSICFECGFQSMSYFYRVFSACRGMSPGAFRKKYGREHLL